jgi:hypothetical protein
MEDFKMTHKIELSELGDSCQFKDLFAMSTQDHKKLEFVAQANPITDETTAFYQIKVKEVVVFKSQSLLETIAKYNSI